MTKTEANDDIESEYNAFGHDPFGVVAHLCHYFFGPEWRPTTNDHLNGLPITKGRPRYGQPSPQQARLLPATFTPRPPPLYFGAPSAGSYIDGPLNFEPRILAALVLQPLQHIGTDPSQADCYQDRHGMEVMNGVYRLHVELVAGDSDYRFSILTNATWEEFRSQIGCKVVCTSDLVYRVTVQTLGSSLFKPLLGSGHWSDMMGAARQGFQQQTDIRVEIGQSNDEDLSNIETYYLFDYPTLAEVNNLVQKECAEGSHLNEREYALAMQAGIEYLDDFTSVSATQLQTWTSIPRVKIQILYRKAKGLMGKFHRRNHREIEEIWEIRRAAKVAIA